MLDCRETRPLATAEVLDELAWRLEEAVAVPPQKLPANVVSMNSVVRLVDDSASRELVCTVVYPAEMDLVDKGVSVLGPIGAALVGNEVGDLVEWWDGENPGRWRIAEIVRQPEQDGDFYR
ncbi:rnk [Symbiodinium sp. CCMP2456]|nr:rnk [Symbiodinium sp. CCMP2456]